MATYLNQLRRGIKDTSTGRDDWAEYEKVPGHVLPRNGELVLEIVDGVRKLKIGDGVNEFSALPYFSVGSSTESQTTQLLAYMNGQLICPGEDLLPDSRNLKVRADTSGAHFVKVDTTNGELPMNALTGRWVIINGERAYVGSNTVDTLVLYTDSTMTTPATTTVTTGTIISPADIYVFDDANLATEAYVNSAIDAIQKSDVSTQINAHNTATDAHNDIRLFIEDLSTRLNTLADSDDTTLDQLSEIVTYIKSNKDLIEEITTNKVNASDIINNLTTNVINKPLSAAQGVAIKTLIDGLQEQISNTTTHGLTLEYQNIVMPNINWFTSIAYGYGTFVGTGSIGVAYSTDGINWSMADIDHSLINWQHVTYGGAQFIAIRHDSYGNDKTYVYSSIDGITWTEVKVLDGTYRYIAYGDGYYILIGDGNGTSTINIAKYSGSWNIYSVSVNDTSSVGHYVAYSTSQNKWVRTAYGSAISYSSDGLSWVETDTAGGYWGPVTYGNDKYVTLKYTSSGNKAAYSTDGIKWTESTLPASSKWRSVVYGNDRFVAVGDKVAAYSTDGITWSESVVSVDDDWVSVTYGSGIFVAVGWKNIVYSIDGIKWKNFTNERIMQDGIDVTRIVKIICE